MTFDPTMLDVPPGATWARGIDLNLVERIVRDERPLPPLKDEAGDSIGEARVAALRLATTGRTSSAIADQLGVSSRTVDRWCAEAGISR